VTAFKIKGVSHEFSAIPNVKEDVVQILLNLKMLRVKLHSDQPVRLSLHAKGQKTVTAGDITKNSEAEVMNTDLTLVTLTSKDAELEMDIVVSPGRGYIPTETREKEELEVDMIAVDSIYSPVRNVGFKVESTRVGNMTNYENVLLSIETDGSITPENAVRVSASVLIEHFNFIVNQNSSAGVETHDATVIATDSEDEVVADDTSSDEKEEKTKKRGRPKKNDA
jgi:DNA-directed RNA polymerase subunit alpha